jgi:hypothetical protein
MSDIDDDEIENLTCLHSENLMILKHIPTDINLALGGVCYTRFDQNNTNAIYHRCVTKNCNNCELPLFLKVSKFIKTADGKCDGKCYDCYKKIINDIVSAKLKEMERQKK